MGFKL
ncbi:hypothetical protein F383_07976 [Gossypium arboreum]